MISFLKTPDSTFSEAIEVITRLSNTIGTKVEQRVLENDVLVFEDRLNGLSGKIASLPDEQRDTIRRKCTELVALALASRNITIELFKDLLIPQKSSGVVVTSTVTAKELYPVTVSVTRASNLIVESNTRASIIINDVITDVTSDVTTDVTSDEDEEEIAIIPEYSPLSLEQVIEEGEFVELLSDDLIDLAKLAAANTDGLQAGLINISVNPLAVIIEDTRQLILNYTSNNFNTLNVSLTGIQSNANLSNEYITLLESIGGRDGLSASVSQLNDFRTHTDRLSGLILNDKSVNAEPDDDSREEYLDIRDVSGDMNVIISYNSNKFRTARYWIQATSGRKHQATELYVIHDNKFVYTREIGTVYTQDPFLSFTSQLADSNIKIFANTSLSNTDFVIYGLRLKISRASQSYSDMSQSSIIRNHEVLAEYLNDGVDYVARQSVSLLGGGLVGNLARGLRDLIADLSSQYVLAQSTGFIASRILYWADSINTHNANIQVAIDSDHDEFIDIGKQIEALEIVYALTTGNSSDIIRGSITPTLNNTVNTMLSNDLEQLNLEEEEEED